VEKLMNYPVGRRPNPSNTLWSLQSGSYKMDKPVGITRCSTWDHFNLDTRGRWSRLTNTSQCSADIRRCRGVGVHLGNIHNYTGAPVTRAKHWTSLFWNLKNQLKKRKGLILKNTSNKLHIKIKNKWKKFSIGIRTYNPPAIMPLIFLNWIVSTRFLRVATALRYLLRFDISKKSHNRS
jgi:hypothetical protein